MKKLLVLSGLMMAAIVAFTNCQPKEAELPVVDPALSNFKIELGLPDTKTANVNDGSRFGTNWAEDDAVAIFCRPSDGGEFVALGKFTLTGGAGTATGQFEPEDYQPIGTLDPDTKFDWYALYPYSDKIKTPASADASGGYMYVGHGKGLDQQGYNSSAALNGDVCPLYATILGVSLAEFNGNSIPVKNLSSVIEFTVSNGTGEDLVVNSLTVQASEPIVGSFYIDITGAEPAYNYEAGSTYVKSTAKVAIQNPGVIPNGSEATIYLPIKPYSQSDTEEFTVTVAGTKNSKSFSKDFSAILDPDKASFEAGKFKKITLSVLPEQVEPGVTVVSTMMSDYVAENNCDLSANQTAYMYKCLDLTDAVRMYTTGLDNCGSFWNPQAGLDWRLYQAQGGNVTVQVANGCSLKSVKFTYLNSNNGFLVNPEGDKLSSDELYECTGNEVTFTVSNTGDKQNGQVRITAVEIKYTGSGTLDPYVAPEEATLAVDPSTINFPATGGEAVFVSVTVTGGDWYFDSQNLPGWVFAFANKSEGKIQISVGDNVGEARSYDFEVLHSNGVLKKTVKINQAAASTGGGTISEITDAGNGKSIGNVVVDWIGYQNFIVKDDTGVMLVRMGSPTNLTNLGIKKGDKVDVSGNVTSGHNMLRFNHTNANPVSVTKLDATGTVSNPVSWTGAQLAAAYDVDNNTAKVTLEGTYTGSSMFTVDGAGDVELFVQDFNGASPEIGTAYTLTGYVYGWSLYNDTTKEVVFYAESLTAKQSGGGDQVVYNKVSKVTSGKTYLFVANNTNGKTYAATNLASNYTYGRLNGTEVTVSGNSITKSPNASIEFVITSSSSGYTIAMSDGRLLAADTAHNGTFQIGDDFGHDFTFTFNGDGTVVVKHVATDKTFYHGGGSYTNFSLVTSVPDDAVYPMLFEKQ